MQRVAFYAAALAMFALASAPALATTTEADFGRGGEGIEKLLAKVHKHKKLKFVVKIPGDGGAGGTAGTKTTTPTSTGATTGDIQPR